MDYLFTSLMIVSLFMKVLNFKDLNLSLFFCHMLFNQYLGRLYLIQGHEDVTLYFFSQELHSFSSCIQIYDLFWVFLFCYNGIGCFHHFHVDTQLFLFILSLGSPAQEYWNGITNSMWAGAGSRRWWTGRSECYSPWDLRGLNITTQQLSIQLSQKKHLLYALFPLG